MADTTTTFSYTGATQTFTAPTSGYHDIAAFGAQSGSDPVADKVGGDGAEVSDRAYLTAGETLTIDVGGIGGSGSDAGAGGGGTFVVDQGVGPVVVAGGGGGAGYDTDGEGGVITTSGGDTANPSQTGYPYDEFGRGGTDGSGGQGGDIAGGDGGSFDSGSDQQRIGSENAGNGFVTIVEEPACFLAGTRILTERGERPVESLVAGDRVATFCGRGAALKPVTWIGRSPFDTRRHPNPDGVRPIRIRQHAFGPGQPARDLLISPWHAILTDGALIPVDRLLNGVTILRDTTIASGTYIHIELDEHDIVLSEGLPSETYKDNENRSAFSNAAGFRQLHPQFRPTPAHATCRPMVLSGPEVVAARTRLAAQALALGYTAQPVHDVHLLTDAGTRIAPEVLGDGEYHFSLPGPCRPTLVSATWLPGQFDAAEPDPKASPCPLGVKVERIEIDDSLVTMDDEGLGTGWYDPERAEGGIWRWTNGRGRLPTARNSVTLRIVAYPSAWSLDSSDSRAAAAGSV